jgi:hypothetical protein
MRQSVRSISPGYFALLSCLALVAAAPCVAQERGKPLTLPARLDEHRIYVEPVTEAGQKIEFYTDTGGGLFLSQAAADRLGLASENLGGEGAEAFHVASLPPFRADASIPLPQSRAGRIPVFAPPPGQPVPALMRFDGMLGQEWFASRVWTFDYPQKRLLLRAAGDVPQVDAAHRLALGFKADDKGKRQIDFPRVEVGIDGSKLDLLFDTGAMTELTATALAVMDDGGKAARATSFITATQFEAWRKAHPGWRVIEDAEVGSGQAMIEVPELAFAGYTIGPVWFTRRADKNFHEFMSQFMDRRVEGAIGGNALRHFRITVDYPAAAAHVER